MPHLWGTCSCGLSCRAVCVGCNPCKVLPSPPHKFQTAGLAVVDSLLNIKVPGASPVVGRSHALLPKGTGCSKLYGWDFPLCLRIECHHATTQVAESLHCRWFYKDPVEVALVCSTPRPAQALAQSVLTSRVRSLRLLYPQKESQRVKLVCSWLSTDGKHRLEIIVCACAEDYCQFSLTNIYIYIFQNMDIHSRIICKYFSQAFSGE